MTPTYTYTQIHKSKPKGAVPSELDDKFEIERRLDGYTMDKVRISPSDPITKIAPIAPGPKKGYITKSGAK